MTTQLAFNRKMIKQFNIRGIFFSHQPITPYSYDLHVEGTKDDLLQAFDLLANQYEHFEFDAPVIERRTLNKYSKVQKMLFPVSTGETIPCNRILAGR